MRNTILVLFCFVAFFCNSQTPFNKVYDINGKYVQMKGEVIIDHNNKIYTAGASFETEDTILNEVNFYVASFNQLGEPINDIIWYNDLNPFNNHLNYNNEVIVYNNNLFFAVTTSFSDTQCVVKVNEELTLLEEHACYLDTNSVLLPSTSFIEFPDDHLTIVGANQLPDIDLIITKVDLREKDKWSVTNPSINSILYFPNKILRLPNSPDRAIIMGIYVEYANGIERDPDNNFGMFTMIIDEDHNVIESNYMFDNITTSGPGFDALMLEDGSIVLTMQTFDREYWNETFTYKSKPVVAKLNPDLSVAWIKPFNAPEYILRPEQLTSIIQAHNHDGYVITGLSYADDYGMIGKVDNEGDSLWHYVVTTLYEENDNSLKDVTHSSDGYYLATGHRFVRTQDDSINSNLQLWIIKFDDNGQIVDVGTTSTTEEPESINGITIYPNPSSDMIYIKQENEAQLSYDLYDAHGRLLQSQKESGGQRILILDVQTYPAGNYHLVAVDDKGKKLHTHKISVVR